MSVLDRRFIKVFVSLIILSSLELTSAQNSCVKQNPCKCMFENGEVLDLSPLGREDDTPRFNISTKIEDRFLWNPCYAFNVSDGCTDVAICEVKPYFPSDRDYALGYQSDVTFTTNVTDRTVQLTYISKGDGKTPVRMSFISLECDSGDADNSTFEAIDIPSLDSDTTKYYFKLRSSYACAQVPTTEGTTTSVETTETTVTTPETTTPIETTVTSPETTHHGQSTASSESVITTHPTPGTTSESPTTNPTMSNVPSSSMSSSIGTSVSTKSPTTPKPKSSHGTLTAVLICVAIVVVGGAIGVTLLVLKRKGKICKPEEYDNL